MKELVALIPENRRKFLEFMCMMKEQKEFKPLSLSMISHELRMSHLTIRKIVAEFESLGFVRIYEVGKAKVALPTEKLKDICEMLSEIERWRES